MGVSLKTLGNSTKLRVLKCVPHLSYSFIALICQIDPNSSLFFSPWFDYLQFDNVIYGGNPP